MKLSILAASLASLLLLTASSPAKEDKKPFDWVPLSNQHTNDKLFYDRNSIETITHKSGSTFNIGYLLTIFDNPVDIPTTTGVLKGSSILSVIIVNCENGVSAKIADMAFDLKIPKKETQPIASREYEEKETLSRLDKKTAIYKALCPVYI